MEQDSTERIEYSARLRVVFNLKKKKKSTLSLGSIEQAGKIDTIFIPHKKAIYSQLS